MGGNTADGAMGLQAHDDRALWWARWPRPGVDNGARRKDQAAPMKEEPMTDVNGSTELRAGGVVGRIILKN
jgi:hypothetical protein